MVENIKSERQDTRHYKTLILKCAVDISINKLTNKGKLTISIHGADELLMKKIERFTKIKRYKIKRTSTHYIELAQCTIFKK